MLHSKSYTPNRLSEDSLDIIRADRNNVYLSILAEIFGADKSPDPSKNGIPTWRNFEAALREDNIPDWMWREAEKREHDHQYFKSFATDNVDNLLDHIACLEADIKELQLKLAKVQR